MVIEIVAATLFAFLVTKELAGVINSERAQRIASFLIVPTIPMLILFLVLVMIRVTEIIN